MELINTCIIYVIMICAVIGAIAASRFVSQIPTRFVCTLR